MSERAAAAIRVVAGVIRDEAGRVLVAQRPPGKPHAGLWEFPGGKVEAGESDHEALRRELHEELGIRIGASSFFHRALWQYPEQAVELVAHEVGDYRGRPEPHHAQALQWLDSRDLLRLDMPAADRPIAVALALPRQYAITPEPARDTERFLAALDRTLASGVRLLQLRAKALSKRQLAPLAAAALSLARRYQALILLNGDWELATRFEFDGVHLRADQLRTLTSRPVGASFLIGASCHNRDELGLAEAIGADFAVLSPVLATMSHPTGEVLGWERFSEYACQSALPVFALGGIFSDMIEVTMQAGGFGVAGISGLWAEDATSTVSLRKERP